MAPRKPRNYGRELLDLINERPPKKDRRPKALSGKRVDELTPSQRHRGSLLRDIAEISVRYPKLTRGFTKQLLNLPKYESMKARTLRRDVAEAFAWCERLLKRIPLDLWRELIGIDPPATMSKSALREKALEHLRKELLAKPH